MIESLRLIKFVFKTPKFVYKMEFFMKYFHRVKTYEMQYNFVLIKVCAFLTKKSRHRYLFTKFNIS